MDLGLQDAIVWVTGASGGIGRATAELFAAEGARVALHGHRNVEAAETWLAEQPWKERALVVHGDVRDAVAMETCAAAIAERWGRIDACVANAGVWPPADLRLDQLPAERLRDTIEVDLLGPLHTARAFLRVLRDVGPRADGRGASIVFTGSTAGRFGERGHLDYAAAKSGLVGAMLSLKNEIVHVDPYARVNLVEPGWTVTHMARPALEVPGAITAATRTMPLRQLARARDVGQAVLWLSSPLAARHVTGQTITVAGGMEGRVQWNPEEISEDEVRARLERD